MHCKGADSSLTEIEMGPWPRISNQLGVQGCVRDSGAGAWPHWPQYGYALAAPVLGCSADRPARHRLILEPSTLQTPGRGSHSSLEQSLTRLNGR